MRLLPILVLASALPAAAQSVVSEPIGFNKVTCLANSDTIVGVPLRKEGSYTTKLASDPVGSTLTVTTINLPVWAADTHYVKFTSGAKNGSWFPISTNTASTLTIDLNGDNLTGVVANDSLVIAEFWTLDSLFPPAAATSDPTTTGHAIVASTSRFASGRMTEVLLPNFAGTGTNLASSHTYFIFNSGWREAGQLITNEYGSVVLYPDTYFTVRHPATVATSTTFRTKGEVEIGDFAIGLSTHATGSQDNYIALQRPVPVSLNALALAPAAFTESTSRFSSGRKDELLVFDNATAAFNKASSATYYYFNGAWRKHGQDSTIDFGTDTIPAGVGFLIRKSPNATGATVFWKNPAAY